MTTKPGDIYKVDLGNAGKVRSMMVVSREDPDAPRALAVCAPVTTANRQSEYEVDIGKPPFLREKSFVNVQGLQAVQHHELIGPIGRLHPAAMDKVRAAMKYAFDL